MYSPHIIGWSENDKAQCTIGKDILVNCTGFKMNKIVAYRCHNCKIVTFEYNSSK